MDYEKLSGLPAAPCGCAGDAELRDAPRALAMAYIEWQKWQNVYPADVGFDRGTIFEDLDKPFIGKEAACDV